MLDRELFRKEPGVVRKDLERRKADTKVVDKVIKLDGDWRKALRRAEELKHTRNEVTREIAALKKAGKSAAKKIAEMKKASADIAKQDKAIQKKKAERDAVLMRVPNLLHESVPQGKSEEDNKEVRKWGKPLKKKIPPHGEILERLGFADFKNGAKISGAGFYFLRGEMVLLDHALQRMALDNLVEKGFAPIAPPLMMGRKAYEGVTDLGDFESVMYKVDGEDNYLIATSEHPLVAMFMGDVIPEEVLPLKLAGISVNFRREIGSHGVDT
ncbi:MAG: serine--tRNA ligase, partial [Candidatus Diapherotrites archaeon]|nr:serine--tRNA ligase [Candidatus Diapherotrites archaeon]